MDTCRTCRRPESSSGLRYDLFAVDVQPKVKLLSHNTSLTIAPGDGLPSYICCDCFAKLAAFQSLCAEAVESDRVYRLDSVIKCEQQPPISEHCSAIIKNDVRTVSPLFMDALDVKQEDLGNDDDNARDDDDNLSLLDSKDHVEIAISNVCRKPISQTKPRRKTQPAPATKPPRKTHRPPDASKCDTYTCDMCGKWYRNKLILAGHLRQHLGLAQFPCADCPKAFAKLANLADHRDRIHTADQPTECPHEGCNKVYKLPYLAREHYARIHLGHKKPTLGEHICDLCGQACLTRATLLSHRKSHMDTKDRPFGCEECGKRFLQKSNLQLHVLRHQNIRNFACPVCPSRMVSKVELRVHLANHDRSVRWPCAECPMVFNRKPSLRAHEVAHHPNRRQYVCRFCSQCFVREKTLVAHERWHAEQSANKDV